MSGIDLAIKFLDGLYVLKKAHTIDTDKIPINSFLGKVKGVGIPINMDLWIERPQPTTVPIATPDRELDKTRMNAS